ncbi:MAG: hypothetical protein QOJ81_1181 [Chloroflexota bacterium]|nr:hypothetical protein [Chloroflexota bacterium]
MRPFPIAPIYHIISRLGLRVGHEPRDGQPAIAWETGTWVTSRQAAPLPHDAINLQCVDISKSKVERTWEEVAGYPLAVDPLTTAGRLVAKPEENARHGGRILSGPLKRRRKGWVYERLVDCLVDGQICTMRLMTAGGHLAVAYEKFRPEPQWFGGTRLAIPRTPDQLFSAQEQGLLRRFAAAMHLDYGEMDVLRDQSTGLIYVVDANRTPTRPPGLAEKDWASVYDLQAEAFKALLQPWGLA